jgi:hypothetical protein
MSDAVFTFRLPTADLDMLRVEAERRRTSVADLIRAALRGHFVPSAMVSMSAGCQHGLTVSTDVPIYQGGTGSPAEFRMDSYWSNAL